jgi:hypothetical protein
MAKRRIVPVRSNWHKGVQMDQGEEASKMQSLVSQIVAPENSVGLQNQQDTVRLCHIDTWMNFWSTEFLRTTTI